MVFCQWLPVSVYRFSNFRLVGSRVLRYTIRKNVGADVVSRYGFIHTKDEIKFLVLYSLDLIPFPVSYSAIIDLVTWCDGGFGYFELSEAFFELIPTGHIVEEEPGSQPLYSITPKGREAAREFEKQLPFPVRETAQRSALRVVRQLRRDATIKTQITERSEQDLTVRMELEGVFAIEMGVVSRAQASMLETTFQKNAEQIYQDLLLTMTKDRLEDDAE